jgi:hypothetical protein
MSKTYHPACDRTGVCQGLGAQACPACDAFECEVACAPDPAPQPTYPFAPGVIDGPYTGAMHSAAPLLKELAGVLALVLTFSAIGGLLAGLIAGWRA